MIFYCIFLLSSFSLGKVHCLLKSRNSPVLISSTIAYYFLNMRMPQNFDLFLEKNYSNIKSHFVSCSRFFFFDIVRRKKQTTLIFSDNPMLPHSSVRDSPLSPCHIKPVHRIWAQTQKVLVGRRRRGRGLLDTDRVGGREGGRSPKVSPPLSRSKGPLHIRMRGGSELDRSGVGRHIHTAVRGRHTQVSLLACALGECVRLPPPPPRERVRVEEGGGDLSFFLDPPRQSPLACRWRKKCSRWRL